MGTQAMSSIHLLPTTVTLGLLDKDGEHINRRYDEQSSNKQFFFIITPDKDDISFIVNRKKDDPIDLCLFDFMFKKERIWKAWCKIIFIPMNKKCLEHFKVQNTLDSVEPMMT